MNYPHRLTITRTTPGASDGMGGTSEGSATVLYDGAADVQDGGAVVRTENGTIAREGDATAFLPPGSSLPEWSVGDSALITWEDETTRAATIKRTVRLDEKAVLAYA